MQTAACAPTSSARSAAPMRGRQLARGDRLVSRAASVNKVPGLKTTSGSKAERPVSPSRAATIAIPSGGWMAQPEDAPRSKKSSEAPALMPTTRREAMFAMVGTLFGASAVGGYFLTRYNVDKEAARVALDALMEDKAFRAAVVEEVIREEMKAPVKSITKLSPGGTMKSEISSMIAEVEAMTAAAEKRAADIRAATEAAAAAEKTKPSKKWGILGYLGC